MPEVANAHTIRCGVPRCKWRISLKQPDQKELDRFHAEFRQHCIESHGLKADDSERFALHDLVRHTVKLI